MTEKLMLCIELHAYWHCGVARGSGALLDARTARDARGLPCVPGRHLKGLLREAVEQAASWGWEDAGSAKLLFGARAAENPADVPQPGTLRVDTAVLDAAVDVHAWLASEAGRGPRTELFRTLHVTAMNDDGVAQDQTLRALEVAIPLRLRAAVYPRPGWAPPAEWTRSVRAALPLVQAIGAGRTRGLGRCTIRAQEAPA